MSEQLIPLFPLGLVLFPGAPLPLYIFEERYKEMIAHCMEESVPFGVVYIDGGKVFNVGTACAVEEVLHTWPDGRLHIHCKGLERFRVTGFSQDKAYLQGTVEPLGDEEEEVDAAAVEQLVERFRLYMGLRAKDDATDEEALSQEALDAIAESARESSTPSFGVLPFVGLEPRKKQELLEITNENERLTVLNRILRESIIAFRRLYRIKGLLGTNGHCPPEGGEWEFFQGEEYL